MYKIYVNGKLYEKDIVNMSNLSKSLNRIESEYIGKGNYEILIQKTL